MLIGFDASRAFIREATGTENYSLNLLRALAKVDRKNQYRVYLRGFSSLSLRDHEVAKQSNSKIATSLDEFGTRNDSTKDFLGTFKNWPDNFEFRPIGPSRFWTQFGLALETWRAPVDLLFVPAHTLPLLRRRFLLMSSRVLRQAQDVAILRDCFASLAMTERKVMAGRRMKYVVTIHDLGVEYLPGYHQFPQRYYLDFASRYAARHADGIIAVSAATKRDLIKRYHTRSKKIFVVHEGVDTRFFKPQPKSKIESIKKKYKIADRYILFVGTVQPRKNLRMLICAFADLVESGKSILRQAQDDPESIEGSKWKVGKNSLYTSGFDFELVIAGKLGWDYDEILKTPKKLGLTKRVKFIGRVADRDLPALYSGASVFAFPSLFEGFGLPILEALACGCPVVASDIAPHREIFEKISSQSGKSKWKVKKNSLYTPHFDSNLVPIVLAKPDDTGQWVNVLYQCISQYEKRSTYIASRNLALDLFSWEKVAVGTLQVFRKLLS